jgi:hypothetical protein
MARIRYRTDIWIANVAASCLLLAASPATGQQPMQWKTGVAFRKQLEAPTTVQGQGNLRTLREGLTRLSQTNDVAIFLDRRIDPGQPIEFSARELPLESILRRIAAESDAEIAIFGSIVYVGPSESAARLATIAALRRQDIAKVQAEARARLLRATTWQWEELSEPRQLLSELAREANVKVQNADVLPHDLWPAVSLPPLPWVDRLTLLIVGFALTFEIDERGTSMRLVPQPATARISRRYGPPGSPTELATQLRRLVPDAQIAVENEQIVVNAAQEDHDKIQRLLSGQSVRGGKTKRPVEKLYSLQVTNEPAGSVLRKVAESLGKELKYDNRVRDKLRQPVQLNLKDASLDYLLDMTLKPLGLKWQVTESALEVSD